MDCIIEKNMSCRDEKIFRDDSLMCSNNIIDKLEKKFNCKLRGENEKDTVNGAVSVYHENNKHKIIVHFYEKNETPTLCTVITQENQPTFKKLNKIPTESEIKKAI